MTEGKKKTRLGGIRAWFIVVLGALFYCYQFIIRVSPGVMNDDIMTTFTIDATVFGLIVGFYYWGYAGVQIPLGIAMDRFGARRLLAAAGILCGIACFIFASTQNIIVASIARFLMGVGSACGFVGTLKLGTLWFSPAKLGQVIALTMVFGTLGATIGGTPLGLLNDTVGWQNSLKILGVIGFIFGAIIYIFVRNGPDDTGAIRRTVDPANQHILSGLLRVASKPQAWLIAGIGALMYVPITIVGIAWGVPFIKSTYHIKDTVAAPVVSMMFWGAAFGSPVFTILSDYFSKRRLPLFVGAIMSCSIWFIIIFIDNIPLTVMYVLFFFAGFFYTAKVLTFAANAEIMPASISGVTVGFTNMVVMLTGVISHPIIGKLLDISANSQGRTGPVYLEIDYRFALSIIPLCLAASILLLQFIKETYPRPHRLAKSF